MRCFVLLCCILSAGCQSMLIPDIQLKEEQSFVPPADLSESEKQLLQIESELDVCKQQLALFLDKDSIDPIEGLTAFHLLQKTMKLADQASQRYEYLSKIYLERSKKIDDAEFLFKKRMQSNRGKPIMECEITLVAQGLFSSLSELRSKRDRQKAQLYADMAMRTSMQRRAFVIAYHKFRENLK